MSVNSPKKINKFNSFVDTDMKLNNFMAVPNNVNKPTEKARKNSYLKTDDDQNEEDEEYDDDFESLSKSQAGLSMSRASAKKSGKNLNF